MPNPVEKWQASWDQTDHCKLREIIQKVQHNLQLPRSRRDQVVLTRLLIGHTVYTHQHIFEKSAPRNCTSCSEADTVKHLLLECPKHQVQRSSNNISDNLTSILLRDSGKVLKFLKGINLYHLI